MVGLIRHNQREDSQKSLRANELAATEQKPSADHYGGTRSSTERHGRRGGFTWRPPMSRALVCSLLVLVAALLTPTTALAHDSWISRGGLKNAAGEWCCGDYDCKSYTRISSTASGWMVDG